MAKETIDAILSAEKAVGEAEALAKSKAAEMIADAKQKAAEIISEKESSLAITTRSAPMEAKNLAPSTPVTVICVLV